MIWLELLGNICNPTMWPLMFRSARMAFICLYMPLSSNLFERITNKKNTQTCETIPTHTRDVFRLSGVITYSSVFSMRRCMCLCWILLGTYTDGAFAFLCCCFFYFSLFLARYVVTAAAMVYLLLWLPVKSQLVLRANCQLNCQLLSYEIRYIAEIKLRRVV